MPHEPPPMTPRGGTPPTVATGAPGPAKTSGLAIASLVLGILSCPLSCVTAIPGLICGIVGLAKIRSSEMSAGPRLSGRGLAITGIVLSAVAMVVAPVLVLVGLLLPAVGAARESARRASCMNNLKQIGLGMALYESTQRCIPMAIVDADGKPLLSWRVAILPYLEDSALYEEFHLDEPWDSPHNLALAERMPAVFACPSSELEPGTTAYLAATGPGMAFGEPHGVFRASGGKASVAGVPMEGFSDGMSRTIVVLEVSPDRAVPWTKPDEITDDPDEASSLLHDTTSHAGRVHLALFADGHIEALSDDIGRDVFKALLTRSGGETIGDD